MHRKNGSALAMALVISAVLMQFAVIYVMQIRNSTPQTHHVDERVRLRYLAHGLTELALLKYQKFPTEFYNAWNYASATGDLDPLETFTINANEFRRTDNLVPEDQPSSTFNPSEIELELATMTLSTGQRWGVEVLSIRTEATYQSRRGMAVTADAVRTVRTERGTSTVIPPPAAAP